MNPQRAQGIDPLLVLRSQLGDKEAINVLLAQVAPKLSAYLRSMLGNSEEVEDVVQEVLLIIYRKIRWLNEPGYLLPWAYRIAAREAFRAFRRRGKQHVQLTEAEWDRMQSRQRPGGADQAILEQQAMEALQGLSTAGRAVLFLHYVEGLSIEDAAEQLGIASGTAKSRLSAGLRKLREQLGLLHDTGRITK